MQRVNRCRESTDVEGQQVQRVQGVKGAEGQGV